MMATSLRGELEAAKWLVDHGANISAAEVTANVDVARSPVATSAVIEAARHGYLNVLRFLHALGAFVFTPLGAN